MFHRQFSNDYKELRFKRSLLSNYQCNCCSCLSMDISNFNLGIQFGIWICPLSFVTLINDGGIVSIMAFAFTIPKILSNYELIDRWRLLLRSSLEISIRTGPITSNKTIDWEWLVNTDPTGSAIKTGEITDNFTNKRLLWPASNNDPIEEEEKKKSREERGA